MDDQNNCFEEELNDKSLLGWWTEGQLTVCVVTWCSSRFDDIAKFYESLQRNLPNGTRIYGRKLKSIDGDNSYCTVLGFPYRLESSDNLAKCLEAQQNGVDQGIDMVSVSVSPLVSVDVGQQLEFVQSSIVEYYGKEVTFGERFEAKDENLAELPPLLEAVEDMWITYVVVEVEV